MSVADGFAREGRVEVAGGSIWYGVAGDLSTGATPLLLIHGGPGMSHDYLMPLADLSATRPVIFYDQLDAGRSDRPNDPANWHIARFLEEIDHLRAALSLRRLIVFGNSWGGTLAAAYAARRPDGLAGVILSSPLLHTDTWIADNAAHRAALTEEVRHVLDTGEAHRRSRLSGGGRRLLPPPSLPDDTVARLRQPHFRCDEPGVLCRDVGAERVHLHRRPEGL
ncbi:MAG: alpha/beta fold hydrolase [Pseudomonadota bacterium]